MSSLASGAVVRLQKILMAGMIIKYYYGGGHDPSRRRRILLDQGQDPGQPRGWVMRKLQK